MHLTVYLVTFVDPRFVLTANNQDEINEPDVPSKSTTKVQRGKNRTHRLLVASLLLSPSSVIIWKKNNNNNLEEKNGRAKVGQTCGDISQEMTIVYT